jgi:WD40 repeat protein
VEDDCHNFGLGKCHIRECGSDDYWHIRLRIGSYDEIAASQEIHALANRTLKPTALQLKLMRSVFATALFAIPCLSPAQGPLPVAWEFCSISGPASLAYSPDGTTLAVAGYGGVQSYLASTGQPLKGLTIDPTTQASIVSYSPDGKTLLIGGYGGSLELWNLSNGKLITTAQTNLTGLNSAAFSPDGSGVVVGGIQGAQGAVELRQVSTGQLIAKLKTASTQINSVAFSPDGKTVAGGGYSANGVVEIWSAANGSLLASLTTGAPWLNSVAYSPDAKSLAVGGETATAGVVQLWDLSSASLKSTFPTSQPSITGVAFTPDGLALVDAGDTYVNGAPYGTTQGGLERWDIATTALTDSVMKLSEIGGFAISPDGGSLASFGASSYEQTFTIGHVGSWSLPSFQPQHGATTGVDIPGGAPPVFSPDGTKLIGGWATQVTGRVNLWNPTTGVWLSELGQGYSDVEACAYSPDGKSVAVGTLSGSVQLLDASTGQIIRVLAADPYWIASMAFSPDGTKLAVCGTADNYTGSVQVWDVSTGTLVAQLSTSANQALSGVVFSPDGSILADCGWSGNGIFANNKGVVELWNPATGTLVSTLSTSIATAKSLTFSPDGKTLAVGGAGSTAAVVELWSVSTRTLAGSLPVVPGSTTVTSLAYLPDGKTLLAASDVGIQGFDPIGQALLGYFSADAADLTVSPDGALLAYERNYDGIVVCPVPHFTSYALAGLTLTPAVVQGGNNVTGTVTLAQPAPAGGVTIGLSSSFPEYACPATVFIPSGASSATFTVTTNPVRVQSVASVYASSGSSSKASNLTINPAIVASLALSPSTIAGGGQTTGTITLSGPAGGSAGGPGITVALSSNNPAVTVPPSVTLPGTVTTISFTVSTVFVTAKTTATIVATTGSVSQSATLTLVPPQVAQVTVNPNSVVGGAKSTGTVTLNGNSGPKGLMVSLSSSGSVVSMPSKVTIPAGSNQASFAIQTSRVTYQTAVQIKAVSGSVSETTPLTLEPVQVSALNLNPTTVAGGETSQGTVTLNAPAGPTGALVRLACSTHGVTIPAAVTVAPGKSSTGFSVRTAAVPSQVVASLTATLSKSSQTASLTILAPQLASLVLEPTTVVGGKSSTGTVRISSPAPVGGLTITLSSNSGSANLPATVKIPAGETSAAFTVKTSKVSAQAAAVISASLTGTTQTAALTITGA